MKWSINKFSMFNVMLFIEFLMLCKLFLRVKKLNERGVPYLNSLKFLQNIMHINLKNVLYKACTKMCYENVNDIYFWRSANSLCQCLSREKLNHIHLNADCFKFVINSVILNHFLKNLWILFLPETYTTPDQNTNRKTCLKIIKNLFCLLGVFGGFFFFLQNQ